eukprot:352672-Chlamydomonas_euryale.AAC.13
MCRALGTYEMASALLSGFASRLLRRQGAKTAALRCRCRCRHDAQQRCGLQKAPPRDAAPVQC